MFDLNEISGIQSRSQLFAAYRETYNNEEGVSKAYILEARAALADLAKGLHVSSEYEKYVATIQEEYGDTYNWVEETKKICKCDRYGNVLCSSANFGAIMLCAPRFSSLRFNELTGMPEVTEKGKTRPWTDSDDSKARVEIEDNFGIHSMQKYNDAFNAYLSQRSYHPIKDKIEAIEWDGVDRIELLLHNCLDIEDTPYTREVSRLIFAGGVNRLYNPGCKFDDMPVLIGKQGGGKSTFTRWLAMEDRFFTELRTIEGQAGIEAINGAWIVEVSELLALTKTKEQEAVKAYLSTLVDKYRPAYGRRTVEQPRTCIFIGTTNRDTFISDKTGGRRFYPVTCVRTGYDLFRREKEVRDYIEQCWAEAYAKLDTPFMSPYAHESIKREIENEQSRATEDDYRVGMIERYLETSGKTKVCFGMLWECALEYGSKIPERADQTQIGLIMKNIEGWERVNWKSDFGKYGKQRFWQRCTKQIAEATFLTPNDDIPF